MRSKKPRERLIEQVASMTEEKVKKMVAWMRSRHTGSRKRRQTAQQEFEGRLASMTNEDIKEMVAGTQQKRPGFLASLLRLPGLTLRAIARMVGWQSTDKGPG